MPQKIIAITGITGNQGASVADAFLSSTFLSSISSSSSSSSSSPSSSPTTWHIRALTRDPTTPAALALATNPLITLVRADLDDPTTLPPALAGAAAIFAMTDFWAPLRHPSTHAAAAKKGVSANELCRDIEVRRGLNLARAARETAGLERFVWSSLSDAERMSGGVYGANLWHFGGKAEVERWVRDDAVLGPKASFVQVGWYVDNWRVMEGLVGKEESGFVARVVGEGRRKVPFVWTRRDVGAVVRGLVEGVEAGKSVLAYSELLSWREFMAKFSEVLGVQLGGDEGIRSLSFQEMKDWLPGDENMKNEIAESMAYIDEFGYDGGDPDVLHPKDIGVESLLTPVEEYIKQEDWSPIL